jgi:predicted DsbA family dithiol-disulfide isomerase
MNATDKTIKVYYDFICPFCYIGKEYAERLNIEFGVEFEWIGWEIHPDAEKDGETRENLEHSFIIKRLAYNLNITFSVPPIRANTHLALQGTEYAKDHGKFREYFEKVMEEYWIKGTNISTLDTLTTIAKTIGLDPEDFSGTLRRDNYKNRVLDDTSAEKLDIQYVPTFVFGGFRIVGNIPLDALREAVKVYVMGYDSKI